MVAVTEVDIASLPSVAVADRLRLPGGTAVYFVLNAAGEVIYIGSALSLRTRWSSHRLRKDCEATGAARIAWMRCDDFKEAMTREVELIFSIKPPLNQRGKTKKMRVPRLPWEW